MADIEKDNFELKQTLLKSTINYDESVKNLNDQLDFYQIKI